MNFSKLLGATMVAGAGEPGRTGSAPDGQGHEAQLGIRRQERVAALPEDRVRAPDARRSGATVAR